MIIATVFISKTIEVPLKYSGTKRKVDIKHWKYHKAALKNMSNYELDLTRYTFVGANTAELLDSLTEADKFAELEKKWEKELQGHYRRELIGFGLVEGPYKLTLWQRLKRKVGKV